MITQQLIAEGILVVIAVSWCGACFYSIASSNLKDYRRKKAARLRVHIMW